MKTIKMFSTALTLAVAFTALSAGAATAHQWQKNGKALGSTTLVKATSELQFENPGGFPPYDFDGCTIHEKGTVGLGGLGEITSVTGATGSKVISCVTVQNCKTPITIEALNLPWKTELVTNEGVLQNHIKGEAEWKIVCKEGSFQESDYCLVLPRASLTNVAKGVDETYSGTTGCLYGKLITRGTGLLSFPEEETYGILSAS